MAIEIVPSRITMLEGNIDYLTKTPLLTKERGFLQIRGAWYTKPN